MQSMLHIMQGFASHIDHARSVRQTAIEAFQGTVPMVDEGETGASVLKGDITWMQTEDWSDCLIIDTVFKEFMGHDSMIRGMAALIDSGLHDLPAENILIEQASDDMRFITKVSRISNGAPDKDGYQIVAMAHTFVIKPPAEKSRNIIKDFFHTSHLIKTGPSINKGEPNVIIASDHINVDMSEQRKIYMADVVGRAYYAAVMVHGMKGIGYETREPHKGQLKEAKRKKDIYKPTASKILRLTYMMNKNGDRQSVDMARMPPIFHIRSAHLRKQRSGVGNKIVTTIKIEMMVINGSDDLNVEDLPTRVRSLKK